jgi:uncharacterized protein
LQRGAKFIEKIIDLMNDFLNRYGQWALVAGSAEGLGEAYSRALARRKMNLVMVDHKGEILSNLCRELESVYGIKTIQIELDLGSKEAPGVMISAIRDLDCRLLVYNAAFSIVKPFLKNSPEELDNYINVNARTLIQIALPFSEKCKAAGGGGILIMSSLAALWGTQLLGPYGATKAFDYILAEALYHELKPFGIDVMACLAGATATPAYLGTEPKYGWPRPTVMKPEDVAEEALTKLGKRAFFISGRANRMTWFLLAKILPRSAARRIFNATTGKMYVEKF